MAGVVMELPALAPEGRRALLAAPDGLGVPESAFW